MLYEEVNPVECFAMKGINVKQITSKSRRNNFQIICEQVDNITNTFQFCELVK